LLQADDIIGDAINAPTDHISPTPDPAACPYFPFPHFVPACFLVPRQ